MGVLPSVHAGEWIVGSRDCFTKFQKALKEGEAKGIWDMLAPESQKAADTAAQMLRETYATMSAAEKAKVEAALQLSAARVSKLTSAELVGSREFLDLHVAMVMATKLSPERTRDGIEMTYVVNGTARKARMMSPTGDKRNYKMILSMPNVAP